MNIDYGPGEIALVITDEGRADGARTRLQDTGAGHGLVGMRERVSLYGGRVEAGPRERGGFRVSAALPRG